MTTVGALAPGTTLTVHVGDASVNVYAPEAAQRHNLFTIAATALPKGTPPPAPALAAISGRGVPRGVVANAPYPLASLLVRVPEGVDLRLDSQNGDVNVTDISGNASIAARHGNVKLMLSGYAQAVVGRGNISVTMGSTRWPGTLRFVTQHGDVDLWMNPNVSCEIHLRTDDGTLFTDFGLRGTSSGSSETIYGAINGGGAMRIDIETRAGAIRLLRLQPQA